jgi:hypothetical protein
MSMLSLLLSIPLGVLALTFWIGLPFVLRATHRNFSDEEMTNGRILGYERDNANDVMVLTVSYEVGGAKYQARVDAVAGTHATIGHRLFSDPALGGSVQLRYLRRDPSDAYVGTATSPWGKTIAVATFAVMFSVSSVVIAVLGYAGIM